MNIVFVNSLEKQLENDRRHAAQVSIAEEDGTWRVIWSAESMDGKSEQELWFEGREWSEMMKVFRAELARKRLMGFHPLIEGYEGGAAYTERFLTVNKLVYYSEANYLKHVYQKLRVWRREQSKAENKIPYMLGTNKELQMIACYLPKSKSELLQIPGFGKGKVNAYGDFIIDVVKDEHRKTSFPLDWVDEKIDSGLFGEWLKNQYEERNKKYEEERKLQHNILECTQRGESIKSMADSLNISRRDVITWLERLEGSGYDVLKTVQLEIDELDQAINEKITSEFKKQGIKYLKPVFEQIWGKDSLNAAELDTNYEHLRLIRLQLKQQQLVESQAS